MNAAGVLETLAAEGLELAVRGGRLSVRPPGRISPPTLALVREHSQELRVLLANLDQEGARDAFEERAAITEFDGGLTREEAERQALLNPLVPRRWSFAEWGDLRPCLLCRNLARSGRCLAAWRGEIRAARDYEPSIPAQPRRCIGYAPKADDPEQTSGMQRWPELTWQLPDQVDSSGLHR